MTQALMELEAKKANFVKRFLTEVNSEKEFDTMLFYLNIVLGKPANKQQPYTEEELQARIRKSEEDIKAGRVYSMDEVTQEMEKKYPWLCE
jgi:hypothetical protein